MVKTPDLCFQVVKVVKGFSQAGATRGSDVRPPHPCFILKKGFWFLERVHFFQVQIVDSEWYLGPSFILLSEEHRCHTCPRSQSLSPKQVSHAQRGPGKSYILLLNSHPVRSNFRCSALISTKQLFAYSFNINKRLPHFPCKKPQGSPIIRNSVPHPT